VVSGRVHLKLTPWKSSKYLNPIKDYEHYDFRSQYNPWASNAEDIPITFLEIQARAGQIIYIPPYWWYSIKYVDEKPSYLSVITYHSAMNLLAHTPDLVFYYLQHQNIQKKYSKYATEPLDEPSSDKEETRGEIITNDHTVPCEPQETVLSAKEATMKLTADLEQ
jgi:hypothetical protein